MTPFRRSLATLLCLMCLLVSAACAPTGGAPARPAQTQPLRVVATTTLIGDVARQVGGSAIDLVILVPLDADPHAFQPVAQDLTAVAEADLILVNGLGFEGFLTALVSNAGSNARLVSLADSITPLTLAAPEPESGKRPITITIRRTTIRPVIRMSGSIQATWPSGRTPSPLP